MHPESLQRFIADVQPAFESDDPTAAVKVDEQANVAVLKSLYDALSRGDGAAVAEAMADNVELRITGPATLPLAGEWKGKDMVLQAAAINFSKLADQKPQVVAITAQGHSLAVVAREEGVVKSTGRSYSVHWLQLYTFRNGKIARILEFCDDASSFDGA